MKYLSDYILYCFLSSMVLTMIVMGILGALYKTLKIEPSEAEVPETVDITTPTPIALPALKQPAKTYQLEATTAVKTYIESYKAVVTAYTAVETCPEVCVMANGKRAYVGAAACPRAIPFGTWVDIEGLGVVVCEDHTAEWTEGRFDIFLGYTQNDHARAKQFGRHVRVVTINHSL